MIIDLQRRLAEAGRIRIGQQVESKDGKKHPAKLETFRLTSSDQLRIRQAAELFGGQVEKWKAPAGQQYQVITEAKSLDVIVPPSDMAFSQAYELWSAGGCKRRCDGRTDTIGECPCRCDPNDRTCDIHTRLSVMLRDLPGLGVWRIDTQGYYAAVELQGAVEIIAVAAGAGQMLPARLRLEQRTVKRPGKDGKPITRRFAVPMLDIEISPGQLMASQQRPAIDAGTGELLQPVPSGLPSGPVPSVADQAKAIEQGRARKPRANAAQPIPATGLAPRTADEAPTPERPAAGTSSAADDRPPPAAGPPRQQDDPNLDPPGRRPVTPVDEMTTQLINEGQSKALHASFNELGITDRAERMRMTAKIVGRDIGTSNDLTHAEASKVLDTLRADLHAAHLEED